jgi:hypothetical protein
VGYKIRRQISEELAMFAVTPTERLVLLEIADLANDDTRIARFGPDAVAERLQMTSAAVRKSVQRLAVKGIELRIPVATGDDGRPVFAHHGKQTNYRVPTSLMGGQAVQASGGSRADNLSTLQSDEGWTDSIAKGGQKSSEGWTDSARRVDNLSTPSPHVSSVPSKNSSKKPPTASSSSSRTKTKTTPKDRKAKQLAVAIAYVQAHTDADEAEAATVIEAILDLATGSVGDIAAYIKACDDEDLADRLEQYRDGNPYGPNTDWNHVASANTLLKAMEEVTPLGGRWAETRDLAYAAFACGFEYAEIVDTVNRYGNQTKDRVVGWMTALAELASQYPDEPTAA